MNYNLNNPGLNTYPDFWLILTTIMLMFIKGKASFTSLMMFIKRKLYHTSLMMFIKVKLYLTSLKMFIKGSFDNVIDSTVSLNLTGWHTDEINKNISSLKKWLIREHHRIGHPIKLLIMAFLTAVYFHKSGYSFISHFFTLSSQAISPTLNFEREALGIELIQHDNLHKKTVIRTCYPGALQST